MHSFELPQLGSWPRSKKPELSNIPILLAAKVVQHHLNSFNFFRFTAFLTFRRNFVIFKSVGIITI